MDKLCPALCDPMDCSLSDSSVHRISQAKILEWVAISFSRVSPGLLSSPFLELGSFPLSVGSGLGMGRSV